MRLLFRPDSQPPRGAAYLHAVRRFFSWVQPQLRHISNIIPRMIGEYFDQHEGSLPTKKLHLAALRAFFDVLVNRHIIVLNSAATVRGERYQAVEGKTREITVDQARTLLRTTDGPHQFSAAIERSLPR